MGMLGLGLRRACWLEGAAVYLVWLWDLASLGTGDGLRSRFVHIDLFERAQGHDLG